MGTRSNRLALLLVVSVAAIAAIGAQLTLSMLGSGKAGAGAAHRAAAAAEARCSVDNVMCLRNAYAAAVRIEGPAAALRDLAAFRHAHPRETVDVCHVVMHDMGHAAAVRDPAHEVQLVGTTGDCDLGFAHGVIDHSFTGVPVSRFAARATELCSNYHHDWDIRVRCGHAVGHAMMHYAGNDFPRALQLCGQFHSASFHNECLLGVHMVNAALYDHSRWIHPAEPLYPCNAIADSLAYNCYSHVAYRAFRLRKQWSDATSACLQARARWQKECFMGLGGRLAYEQHLQPRAIQRVCQQALTHEGDCLGVAAAVVVSTYPNGVRGAHLCAVAPTAGGRASCAFVVGESMWVAMWKQASVRSACAQMPDAPMRTSCLVGTRLLPGAPAEATIPT